MSISAVLLFILTAVAGPTQSGPNGDEKTVTAGQVTSHIAVDGILDEPDWSTVKAASSFRQYEPIENADPSHQTEVKVLYGATDVFIGILMYDTEPEKILRPLGRRDDENNADWFFLSVDSYLDRKTAYVFGVSASGVQLDGLQTDSGRSRGGNNVDTSWDAVWDSSVRVTQEGWVVEIRIPYAMLRFPDVPSQKWGINFQRVIARLGEVSQWVYIPRNEPSKIAQFGLLTGIEDIAPRRNIQFLPYTVSSLDNYTDEDTNLQVRDFAYDFGADVKVGITSNLTLDASFNPDFGQVEADPAELNLTTFETVLREKRPFFTEGSQIFDLNFGGREGAILYTRRIGSRDPIVGAAKISGRTDRGLSLGVVTAATGDHFRPDRYYVASRIKKELGAYSKVGGGITWFDRTVPDEKKRSYVGAADFDLRFKENAYQLNGYAGYSSIVYPEHDEDSNTGFTTSANFGRLTGNTTWNTSFEVFSDNFNPNDVGRLRQNNYVQTSTGFNRLINNNQPFGPFRRASLGFFGWHDWSYDDLTPLGIGTFIFSRFQTKGFSSISLNANASGLGGYDNRETRDIDMLYRDPWEYNLRVEYETDSRKSYNFQPTIRYTNQKGPGKSLAFELGSEVTIGTRLSLEAGVDYNISDRLLSWASNEVFTRKNGEWAIGPEDPDDDPDELLADDFLAFDDNNRLEDILTGYAPYDGTTDRFYIPVFGERDRRSLEFSLRTNITFTPKLTLQLFSQLFVARGQFSKYALLSSPDDLHPFEAYPKRHDFSLNNFQSNAVLRWEYRPGSTLYLVWTQARGDSEFEDLFLPSSPTPYGTPTREQLGDTFLLNHETVFLIKFNYLFMR